MGVVTNILVALKIMSTSTTYSILGYVKFTVQFTCSTFNIKNDVRHVSKAHYSHPPYRSFSDLRVGRHLKRNARASRYMSRKIILRLSVHTLHIYIISTADGCTDHQELPRVWMVVKFLSARGYPKASAGKTPCLGHPWFPRWLVKDDEHHIRKIMTIEFISERVRERLRVILQIF